MISHLKYNTSWLILVHTITSFQHITKRNTTKNMRNPVAADSDYICPSMQCELLYRSVGYMVRPTVAHFVVEMYGIQ